MSYIRSTSNAEGLYIINSGDDTITIFMPGGGNVLKCSTADFGAIFLRYLNEGADDTLQCGALKLYETFTNEDHPILPRACAVILDSHDWPEPVYMYSSTAQYMAYEVLRRYVTVNMMDQAEQALIEHFGFTEVADSYAVG